MIAQRLKNVTGFFAIKKANLSLNQLLLNLYILSYEEVKNASTISANN